MIADHTNLIHSDREELLSSMAVLLVFLLWLQVAGGSLTSNQKKEILQAHNYYRGRVDPIATNMMRMVSQQAYLCC